MPSCVLCPTVLPLLVPWQCFAHLFGRALTSKFCFPNAMRQTARALAAKNEEEVERLMGVAAAAEARATVAESELEQARASLETAEQEAEEQSYSLDQKVCRCVVLCCVVLCCVVLCCVVLCCVCVFVRTCSVRRSPLLPPSDDASRVAAGWRCACLVDALLCQNCGAWLTEQPLGCVCCVVCVSCLLCVLRVCLGLHRTRKSRSCKSNWPR